MVRFITRYMEPVRRLRLFIKRTIDRRFTVTIATDTVRNAANQVMHKDDIMACYFFRFTLLIPFFSLLLVYLSEEFEKYFNKERGQRRLMLVPQRSLMEILIDSIGCWNKRFSFYSACVSAETKEV